MSRFDDDLRRATAPLAGEALPPGVLDEALDSTERRPSWTTMATVSCAAILVVVAAGIGIGELLPPPAPSPPVAHSPEAQPSDPSVTSCENIRTPAAAEDVVIVYFPCGAQAGLEPTGVTRPVPSDMRMIERLRTAMRSILDGPSDAEMEAGMVAVVPASSSGLLGDITVIADGLATIDFDPALADIGNLSTSAASNGLLGALRETALQFEEVTALELQLGGSCDAFYEHLQGTCRHLAEPVAEMSDCPIVAPSELPSGAMVTEPRPYPGEPMVSWGSGRDTVTELPGHRDGGPLIDDGWPVTVRGFPGLVVAVGEVPDSQVQIGWVENGCPYLIWIAGDNDLGADGYAERFGPVVAQPSAPPAVSISRTVEDEGIRLTITLDRDRMVFAQRVHATATVENVGADPVFWGHSGTCAFPASLQVRPDDPVRMPYGRDDWPGEEGILKNVTVDNRLADADPVYSFLPEGWLDFEGNMGCTSDLVVSELPAGESLVQRLEWDTMAHYEMPPSPGMHTVDAVFSFMSRGAFPAAEEAVDQFAVEVPLPIIVEGPEVVFIGPGEAVDALLADDRYSALLTDAPRDRWVQSSIAFVDGRWEAALYLSEDDTVIDPVEALVGTVDAQTGEVIGVGMEERTRPPGG